MTHVYQLDLATMLTVLARQTGRLHTAEVVIPGIESPCEVVVMVVYGRVQACRVFSQGRMLPGDTTALQRVLSLGVLSWTYTPDVPSTSAPPALDLATLVPQRVREVPPGALKTWPRLPRVLYQLTDGTHSLDHLAHLLSQPLDGVLATAMQLQQQGVLSLVSQQEQQEGVHQRFPALLSSVDTP